MKAAVMLFSPKKKLHDVDPPFRTLQMKKSFSWNLKNLPVQRLIGSDLRASFETLTFFKMLPPVKEGRVLDPGLNFKLLAQLLQPLPSPLHHQRMVLRGLLLLVSLQGLLNLDQVGITIIIINKTKQ